MLLCVAVAFTSCSKDDNETPEPPAPDAIISNKALIETIEASEEVAFVKDANGDVNVTTNKALIESITTIDLSRTDIADLKGIEYFTATENLYCALTKITDFSYISKLIKLKNFRCDSSQFTTLDLSKLTQLEFITCRDCKLTTLNVSQLANLTTLYCDGNKLETLDLSGVVKLADLNCYGNQLTSLDLSKLTELNELRCQSNRLSAIDISKTKLQLIKGKAYIGSQTSDGSTAKTISATVTQTQKDGITADFSASDSNRNITFVVAN